MDSTGGLPRKEASLFFLLVYWRLFSSSHWFYDGKAEREMQSPLQSKRLK